LPKGETADAGAADGEGDGDPFLPVMTYLTSFVAVWITLIFIWGHQCRLWVKRRNPLKLSELFDDCGLDFAYHHLPIGCSGCCVDCSDPDELLVHELLDAHQLSTRVPPGRHFLDQMETERPTLGHDHRKEGDL